MSPDPEEIGTMKTLTKCSKFTPVGGKLTAVLIAAFLAALSQASLAQGPKPDPSSATVWIQKDGKGDRYHCYIKNGSPYCDPLPLVKPAPLLSATPAICRWGLGGIVC
jgi:hypothetical protein